jgi:hypothetical protein
MSKGQRIAVAAVGVVGLLLIATVAMADTAAYDPKAELKDVRVMLAADRIFGFAPMTVNLSGMVKTEDGDLRPVGGGEVVRVVVESPLLRVQNGLDSFVSLVPDMHYESQSLGPVEPSALRKTIEIRSPGRYTFRVQVVAADGGVLSSNEVDVRAF